MIATGDHLLQLQLDPSVYQRHVEAMAAFEAGRSEFAKAVKAVLRGRPGALDRAQAVMERLTFREEPDLTKVGPTRVPMQIRHAPQLTREEADALLQAQPTSAGVLPRQQSELAVAVATASSPPTPADLAPTIDVQITTEITDKGSELGNSPLAIYEFVRNNIAFQPYVGSRKGSVFTLQQRAGNDTDQASLLLALLRAANIPSRYVRGTVEMTPQQAMDWLGVEDAATAGSILTTAGLDGVNVVSGSNVVAIRCTRVWVEAYIPYGNYRGVANDDTGKAWIPLDPAFKGNTVHSGEDVLTAMGFNPDAFLADYISTFHAQSPLEKLQTDVQTWLNVNRPGKTVADIERTLALGELNLGVLPASLPYKTRAVSSRFSELENAKRYQVRFYLHDGGTTFIDYPISLPELVTKRLVVDYVGATPADQATIDAYGGIYQTPPYLVNVKPRLKLDGTAVVTSTNATGIGYTHSWDMYFLQPAGDQNGQPVIYNTITTGNGQSVAFDTFLDLPLGFLGSGSSSAGSLLDSILNNTAARYLSRVDRGEEAASRLLRMVSIADVSEAIVENSVKVTYSSGIPVTFEWTGLTVDADRRIIGPFAVNGNSANNVPYMSLTGYDGSNMENRVFEDTFVQEAISTVKILELANDAGIVVCTITSSIGGQCPGFSQPGYVVDAVNAALAQGHHVIIPKAPITVHLWSGTGYIDLDPTTGAAGYIIAGGNSGNVTVSGGATVGSWSKPLSCPLTSCTVNSPASGTVYCADSTPIILDSSLTITCDSGTFTQPWHIDTGFTAKSLADSYGGGDYSVTISADGITKCTSSFTVVQVVIKQGGQAISNTTHDEIVGKRIDLAAEIKPTSLAVTTRGWTVPGNRVADYAASSMSASVTALTTLDQSTVQFYWVDGADGRDVKHAVTVNGHMCMGVATFNVKRPTATVTTTTGTVAVDSAWGDLELHCGSPTSPCTTFSRSITVPSGFSGSTQWVQIVSTLRRRQLNNGTFERLTGSGLLDTKYPYDTSASTNDSPGEPLTPAFLQDGASDIFAMHLMFKPSGTAIWVPLSRVDWSWAGQATRTGANWSLVSSTNPSASVADEATHPTWTSNVTGLSWVPE
jgi:transglutaminase-like putative cysteine protease